MGLDIRYSQGFNPHPKMGFAQPLSLGYSSIAEYLEFETITDHDPGEVISLFKGKLPGDVRILDLFRFDQEVRSLAAETIACRYLITMPVTDEMDQETLDEILKGYLSQDQIRAMKRMKKTKSMEEVDIKDKITCYLPQTSVIGRLLNSNSDYEVIHSDSPTVVMQHDVMTWQIDVTQIERVQETTEESRYLQQVFAQWNNKLSYEDKYVFLNTMYDILTESGITSANPVFADKTLMIRKMLAAYPSLNEETKGIFLYVMSTLFKTNVQAFQDVYLNKYLRRLRKEKKSNEDTGNQ